MKNAKRRRGNKKPCSQAKRKNRKQNQHFKPYRLEALVVQTPSHAPSIFAHRQENYRVLCEKNQRIEFINEFWHHRLEPMPNSIFFFVACTFGCRLYILSFGLSAELESALPMRMRYKMKIKIYDDDEKKECLGNSKAFLVNCFHCFHRDFCLSPNYEARDCNNNVRWEDEKANERKKNKTTSILIWCRHWNVLEFYCGFSGVQGTPDEGRRQRQNVVLETTYFASELKRHSGVWPRKFPFNFPRSSHIEQWLNSWDKRRSFPGVVRLTTKRLFTIHWSIPRIQL